MHELKDELLKIIGLVSQIDNSSLSVSQAAKELSVSFIVMMYIYSLLTSNKLPLSEYKLDDYRPIFDLDRKLSNLFVLVHNDVIALEQVAEHVALTPIEISIIFQVKDYLSKNSHILTDYNPLSILSSTLQEGFDEGLLESISERVNAFLSSIWSKLNCDNYDQVFELFYISAMADYVLQGSLSSFAASNESKIPWWRYSRFLKQYIKLTKADDIPHDFLSSNDDEGVFYFVNDYTVSQMFIQSLKKAIELAGGCIA